MEDIEYDLLTVEEKREYAIKNEKAYGKTRLKDEFEMRPKKGAHAAFFYKNPYGRGENPCYLVKDCIPIQKRKEKVVPSEKQKLGSKISALKSKLRSNAMMQAKYLSEFDRSKIVFIDSETTGLNDEDQIIELAIIDGYGQIIFDKRFKPTVDISAGAERVHGISAHLLTEEKNWTDFVDEIKEILLSSETVFIFNADFDLRLIQQTSKAFNQDTSWEKKLRKNSYCMMDASAAAFGATNRYGSISLQYAAYEAGIEWKGRAHSAVADAHATYSIYDSLVTERANLVAKVEELEKEKALAC